MKMHENAGIKYAILFPQVPRVRVSGIFIFLIACNKTSLLKIAPLLFALAWFQHSYQHAEIL